MDFAVLKAVFSWVQINKEGFWQGMFLLLMFGALFLVSKIVGKGKVMAGGVLDTYTKMVDDLKRNIADERADMQARINTLKDELEQYRKAKADAEDKALAEHTSRIAALTQLAAIKEALAREGEVAVQNPDGSVTIKPGTIGGL